MLESRQCSILSIILNNSLFIYGGAFGLSIYGIIGRLMMFANFPVLGITQGFIPIVGYNYGAKLMDRVTKIIRLSMLSATLIAFGIFSVIMIFTPQIISIFTNEPELIRQTTPALRLTFLATPLIAINLLGGAYFQAIGRATPALILSISKQGFLLIPLILVLPVYFGNQWNLVRLPHRRHRGRTNYTLLSRTPPKKEVRCEFNSVLPSAFSLSLLPHFHTPDILSIFRNCSV